MALLCATTAYLQELSFYSVGMPTSELQLDNNSLLLAPYM